MRSPTLKCVCEWFEGEGSGGRQRWGAWETGAQKERFRGGVFGKITFFIHSLNTKPDKAGHGIPFPLAQRLQLAAKNLVCRGREWGKELVATWGQGGPPSDQKQ